MEFTMRLFIPHNITIGTILLIVLGSASLCTGGVYRDADRIYLLDRTGESWDITQAVSLGFEPHGFQFGIGRNAIRSLDSPDLNRTGKGLSSRERVIGVENGADAQAYVVRKLTRHEIANSQLGETPIAAAY